MSGISFLPPVYTLAILIDESGDLFGDENSAVIVPEVVPRKRPEVRAFACWNHLHGRFLALRWLQNQHETGVYDTELTIHTVFFEIKTTVGQIGGESQRTDRTTYHLATTTGI